MSKGKKLLKKSLKPKMSQKHETPSSTAKKMAAVSDQFIKKAGMEKHFKKSK